MSGTTLEEARRCPKCEEPGKWEIDKPLETVRGAKIKIYKCENSRCQWFNTTWTVQVNSDGTIPPATLTRPKQFRPLVDDGGATVRALEQQVNLETGGGGEVSSRSR